MAAASCGDRSRRRGQRGSPEARVRWRSLCFAAGIAVELAAALALEGLAGRLIYVTTVERVLIGDLGPLLLALGLTGAVPAPLARLRAARQVQALTLPSVALTLWIGNMALWYLPPPYEAAREHAVLMLVEQVLFALTGLAVWLALIGPAATERWRGHPGRWVLYALFWRALPVALGVGGIVSPIPFYPHYVATDVAFTLSTLSDQGIAGCVLIGESALVAIGLLAAMYVRLGREGEGGRSLRGGADALVAG